MSAHLETARVAGLRAGGEPTDAEAAHLFACARCAASLAPSAEVEAMLSTLRDEPFPHGERRLADGEARLLAAMRARRMRPRWVGAAVFAASAAALVVVMTRGSSPDASHAAVTPGSGAVETVQAGRDEILAVRGNATFHVEKLPGGHRFRVRAGGDELEVRGTTFAIESGDSGFTSVRVSEGVVDVRPACCAEVRLRAGDAWAPPQVATSSAASPDEPPPAIATASTGPSPQGRLPSDATPPGAAPSELLARGTAAYDAGSYATAASLFAAAIKADPSAAWARDAAVLAGAAQVLQTAPDAIASLGVSLASLDAAAKRAQRGGDARRAAMASLAAARRSKGEGARNRYCALKGNAALGPAARAEAERGCDER